MCRASEIMQGKEGGWVVVGPTCGGSFIECIVTISGVCERMEVTVKLANCCNT